MNVTEKRQFPRVESSNLSYAYLDKNNQIIESGTGRTKNISEGGFLLETHMKMKKKHSLIVTIELPDGPVELHGTVVHCQSIGKNKYIAGVQIKDMAEADKPLWKKLIERLLKT